MKKKKKSESTEDISVRWCYMYNMYSTERTRFNAKQIFSPIRKELETLCIRLDFTPRELFSMRLLSSTARIQWSTRSHEYSILRVLITLVKQSKHSLSNKETFTI